nr:AAA family ATPase [Macrococcus goetzii]
MAIVDKDRQRFDEVTKKDRLGLISALIHASYKIEDYKYKLLGINRNLSNAEKIVVRLIPLLEIYKREGRFSSFGENLEEAVSNISTDSIDEETLKKYLKKFDSLRTPGNEMGIWIDKAYTLSNMANEVAEGKLSIRNYISIVFINLFSYFYIDGELKYKNILYEILTYFKVYGKDKSYSKEILIDILHFENEKDNIKKNNQKNILFDYLISTEFFIKCEQNNDKFVLSEFAQNYLDDLIELCNLKYKFHEFEDVKQLLNRNTNSLAYAEYLSENKNKYLMLKAKYFLEKNKLYNNNEKVIESNIISENKLFYGAPGTGKSFNIQNYIKDNGLTNYNNKIEHPNVFRTTLHPESSYHDFVGQIMPVVTKDKDDKDIIKYDFKPQVFTLALERALEKNDEPVFLILEEMSRANVAAVFGDIFQLLDRDEDGRSEYLIDNELIQKYLNEQFLKKNIGLNLSKVYIPHNLFIIGTVNTSDQNVFVMDTAFKRRFEFEYLDANYVAPDDTGKPLNNFVFNVGKTNFSWINFIHKLNEFIVDDLSGLGLSEDKQLGQFFIKFKLEENVISELSSLTEIENQTNYAINFNKLKGKLLQYLWNDIRGASYSEKSLFDSNIKSFGELYKKFEEKEQVFSKEFLEKFVKEESYNEI